MLKQYLEMMPNKNFLHPINFHHQTNCNKHLCEWRKALHKNFFFGLKPKHWTLRGNDVKQQLQQVLTPNKFLHTTYLAKD